MIFCAYGYGTRKRVECFYGDNSWIDKKAGKGDENPGLKKCANGLVTMYDSLEKEVWDEKEVELRAEWLYEQAKSLWKMI